MAEILSQEEINALLKEVEEGRVGGGEEEKKEKEEKEYVTVDFLSGFSKPPKRLSTLEAVNRKIADVLSRKFSNILQEEVTVSSLQPEFMEYGNFIETLPVPTNINEVKIPPLRGSAIFVIDANIIFSFLEILFGGRMGRIKVEGRKFTPIEERVIKRIITIFADAFKESWRGIYNFDFSFVRSEIAPEYVKVADPTSSIVISQFDFEITEPLGAMILAIPFDYMKAFRDIFESGIEVASVLQTEEMKRYIMENILRATIEVEVEIGKGKIDGRDLLSLSVGDVIRLDTPSDGEIALKVSGIPKFFGKPGRYKGNYAVRIVREAKKDEG